MGRLPGTPAWNQASAMLGGQVATLALSKPGAYLNANKRLALFQSAMQACDALDGVIDGLISNQAACNATFDPATAMLVASPLRCPGGVDSGDTCLSDAQIAAVRTMNAPAHFAFPLARGNKEYPGYNVWGADLGVTSASPRAADCRVPQPRFGAARQSDANHGAIHQPAAGRGTEEHHHTRPDVQSTFL
jgi:feruloyl esterase